MDLFGPIRDKVKKDIEALNTTTRNIGNLVNLVVSGEDNNGTEQTAESSLEYLISVINEADGGWKSTKGNALTNGNSTTKSIMLYYSTVSKILSAKLFQTIKTKQFCLKLVKQYGELQKNANGVDDVSGEKIDLSK